MLSVGEDGFGIQEIAWFCNVFGRYMNLKEELQSLGDYTCLSNAEYKGGMSCT